MDPSFESFYASPNSSGDAQPQERRPRFLSAIGDLVNRSLKSPLRLKSQKSFDNSSESSQSGDESSRSVSRQDSDSAPDPTSWRPRGRTNDLDDYLSLDQLENVWQNHDDSYTGAISIPLTPAHYTFQEAVEAPTFVQHKRPRTDSPSREKPLPNLVTPRPDEANIVDGVVHPALRLPTPRPQEEEDDEIIPPPANIISPISTWTYERKHVF